MTDGKGPAWAPWCTVAANMWRNSGDIEVRAPVDGGFLACIVTLDGLCDEIPAIFGLRFTSTGDMGVDAAEPRFAEGPRSARGSGGLE